MRSYLAQAFFYFCLTFLLGSLPLLLLPALNPYAIFMVYGVIFALFCLFIVFYFQLKKIFLLSAIFLLGFCCSGFWGTFQAQSLLNQIEPYVDKEITVNAEIRSLALPEALNSFNAPFSFLAEIYQINQTQLKTPILILLSTKEESPFLAGQIWRFKLKTKAIHAELNEGGFDVQRFYFSKRILLKGTILQAQLQDSQAALKQKIATPFLNLIALSEYPDLMLALALGDRSLLSKAHKTLLFETGVIHLLAISGMHIVLVYFLAAQLIAWLARQCHFKYGLYWLPIICGFGCAFFYGWLTGFAAPTQRALLALFLWLSFKYFHCSFSSWKKWLYIVFLLLLFDPLMILSESFWLSCYAVLCLIAIAFFFPFHFKTKNKALSYVLQLARLQFFLTILLLPIQIDLFQGFSLASILTNLIAIPMITLIVFPAILLLLICSQYAFLFYFSLFLIAIIDGAFSILFYLLSFFTDFWINVPAFYFPLSFLGFFLLFLWRIRWINGLFLLFAGCLFLSPLTAKSPSLWQMHQLDIGHGLSIVISRNGKALIYDVGASTPNGSKAARSILPFLNHHHLELEKIIISHEDDDHIGGLNDVKNKFKNADLITSSNQFENHIHCIAGTIFYWQDLKFTILWPNKTSDSAKNADSCVIQIEDGKHRILLTGDLEAAQEMQLAQFKAEMLKADILQVPHHGSKTSSTYAFLAKVNPKIALISTARYNPWKLPAQNRLDRHQELQIPYLISYETGQISIHFHADHYDFFTYRNDIKPRWYHDVFGKSLKTR